jgi:beta-glucanase (GH16 family)
LISPRKFLLSLVIVVALWHLTQGSFRLPKGKWEVVFEDNFDGGALDTAKWSTCYFWAVEGEGCKIFDNGELEWYVPENVIVEDGLLKLRAEKRSVNGYDYASGMVATHTTFVFQYGYVEMRARLPAGRGLWPAFWTMADDKKWPPELDIFDFIGHEPRRVVVGVHYGNRENPHKHTYRYFGPNLSQDFHTYAMQWSQDELVWYLDDEEIWRETRDIPAEPMYLIANLAVGGHWPGNPNSETPFPSDYQIDYVRVWQRVS